MDCVIHSHRHAQKIVSDTMPDLLDEMSRAISGISDDDLIAQYPKSKNRMSLSAAINDLIYERLTNEYWESEVAIFQDPVYQGADAKRWRLDFAKRDISIEVAFNHAEAMAWNLIKPVLASELNHVRKAIQTKIGVIILATEDLKAKGGFDGAVGTYETALRYLKPMNNILTVPLMVIGLNAPRSFRLEVRKVGGRNVGQIIKI